MQDKPFWKSKTIITAVVILGVGIAQYFEVNLPYELVYSVCATVGLVGVRQAISKK